MTSPEAVQEKAIDTEALRRTVQQPPPGQGPWTLDAGFSPLFFVASASEEITPWGTNIKLRDKQLREFIPIEPTFASVLGIVCARNSAFSWKLEGSQAAIDHYSRVFQTADFGKGWAHFIVSVSIDLYTQDTGAFIEVIRERDAPDAMVVGIAHLDAARCYPTGIDEAPVMYLDRSGRYHLLKWYQVIHLLEVPATFEGIPGVQYCALTRVMRACRIMRDIGIYLQEKIGGRQNRAVTLVKGVTPDQITEAWDKAKIQQDAAGLLRFSQPLLVGSVDPKADIGFETLEIASIPDGFDLDLSMKQYIGQLAMGFMTDYQEFAPLPGGGLGTSQQSEVLHKKSKGKGPGLFMKLVADAINWTILPENEEFKWDEQDTDGEKEEAENAKLRAEERSIRVTTGELTKRGAIAQAFEDGDISQELRDEMLKELEQVEAEEAKREDEERPRMEQMDIPASLDDEGTPGSQRDAGDSIQEEEEKARDDRAGTEEVSEDRLAVEDDLAKVIDQAFGAAREALLRHAGA